MKIERGIKISPITHHCVKGKYVQVREQMKIGDSILFGTKNAAHSFATSCERHGFKFTRRTRNKLAHGETGFRVWLIAKSSL